MKKVDPKRLLPSGPSKGSSSLVATNFLVPASNITTRTYAKVDDDIKTPQQQDLKEQTTLLKNKFILAEKLFGEKTKLEKRKTQKQRLEKERERRGKKEKEIESRTFKFGGNLPTLRLPRTGFLDTIRRFVLYSVLGLAVDRIIPILPKLINLAKKITPVLQFFTNTVGNIVNNTAEFIDRGYKAADFLKQQVDNILPEGYQETFDKFTNNFSELLSGGILISGAILGLRGGPPNAVKDALRGGGSLASGIDSSRYYSRYASRTVKDTAPSFRARVSNMMLRTSLGMPRAKDLPTKEALKNPAFALQYIAQKESYTSAKDKAIAKSIVDGAVDSANQALRRAGLGVMDDASSRNVARNTLRAVGFGNVVGKNEPLRPKKSKKFPKFSASSKPTKIKIPDRTPRPLTSTQLLGQGFGAEIARIKKTFMKLGYQPTDLIKIVNDVDGQDFFTRKAAYDILVKKGKIDRVINVPDLGIPGRKESFIKNPREATRRILEGQRFRRPSIPGPGEGITPRVLEQPAAPARPAGIFDRGIRRSGRRLAIRVGGKGAARLLGKVPVIGPLVDFIFNIASGDSITRAAAGAAGAALGSAAGAAIGSVIPLAGTLLGGIGGGILGDILGKSLYDSVVQAANVKKSREGQKKFMDIVLGSEEEEIKPFTFAEPNGSGGPTVIDQSGLPALPPTNTIPGQNYGAPRDDNRDGIPDRKHAGVDFDAGPNDTFYSRIGGKVIKIGVGARGYGNYVDIYNKDLNVVERIAEGDYNHVRLGDVVQPGDAIQTGTSQTGVFHYEIRKGSTSTFGFQGTVNPIEFLNRISKSKTQANIVKPNKSGDIASLTTTPDYGDGQTNVIIVPKPTVVNNNPIVASNGGGGSSLYISNSSIAQQLSA